MGGSQWSWAAVGEDSVFYFDVFILLVSFPLRCCLSFCTLPMTEQRKEKLCRLPVLQLTITKHKH